VVRLNADGSVDPSFGEGGVQQIDLGANVDAVGDDVWSIDRDAQDRILVFGATKGADPRVDRDRIVVRLSANGTPDPTFATDGVHTVNIANLSDQFRNGQVLANGQILTAGYTSQPTGVGTQSANRVVLVRLNPDGLPDATFGVEGIVNTNPFMPADPLTTPWGFVEAYAARPQTSGAYVTTGYGRPGGEGTVDMVSLRFTADGVLDPTWGTAGVVQVDLIGENDRGRNLLVLPDDRVVIVGTATPASINTDALVLLLSPQGALDPSFDGDGVKLYDFGGSDEQFYAVALAPSGNWVAVAGYSGSGEDNSDDATLLLLPLAGGAEVAQVVALSATEDDRFWGVTFDNLDRVYAAGFVTENGDSRLVVQRYLSDGTLDSSFGVEGTVSLNLIEAGTAETVRGIVLQSDGKIVIAGTVEAE
jgi:uncharacterized delta-60 repeat protein